MTIVSRYKVAELSTTPVERQQNIYIYIFDDKDEDPSSAASDSGLRALSFGL